MAARQTKAKKKIWCPLLAPKLFNGQVLGKSRVTDSSQLVGKVVRTNVMNLIGDMKKQYLVVSFKVNEVKDNQGLTQVQRFTMIPASIKRLVRRNRDRIDSSFIATTKDGIKVRVKPLLVTRFKTSRSVRTALRKAAQTAIAEQLSQNTFESNIKNIVLHKIQSGIKNSLKKIYPLRLFDIRVLERIA